MVGRAQTFSQGNRIFIKDRSSYVGLYAQDAWTLKTRLTVNAGLRWEPYLPFVEENGNSVISISRSGRAASAAPSTGTRRRASSFPATRVSRQVRWPIETSGSFAPRVSAALDVNGNGR
jgi:hypothetical protein